MGRIETWQDKQKQSEAKDKKENYKKYGIYLSCIIFIGKISFFILENKKLEIEYT